MIAALFVERGGCYWDVPGVDPWDVQRDARLYRGPYPVVAHPPCQRWCRLAPLIQSVYGYRVGDDEGTFASALASVRAWGGVLEHPAYSRAWAAHALPRPPARGWQRTLCGGAVAQVEQHHWGHPAAKKTWLYAVACVLPPLRYEDSGAAARAVVSFANSSRAMVSRLYRETPRGECDHRRRLSQKEASSTPVAFRDLLLAMASTVRA